MDLNGQPAPARPDCVVSDTLRPLSAPENRSHGPSDPGSDSDPLPTLDDSDPRYKALYEGLSLHGEGLPSYPELTISYRDAWRVCKQGSAGSPSGCLCVRRNFYEQKAFNSPHYAVCDGTDPERFLVLQPKNPAAPPVVVRWVSPTPSFWEILGAYWVWKTCSIFYVPSAQTDAPSSTFVIEGLSPPFFEALLKCA